MVAGPAGSLVLRGQQQLGHEYTQSWVPAPKEVVQRWLGKPILATLGDYRFNRSSSLRLGTDCSGTAMNFRKAVRQPWALGIP